MCFNLLFNVINDSSRLIVRSFDFVNCRLLSEYVVLLFGFKELFKGNLLQVGISRCGGKLSGGRFPLTAPCGR